MPRYGSEVPSPETAKGQWQEYCKVRIFYLRILNYINYDYLKNMMSYYFFQREERIQNYIAKKNGTPHGTFLVPPDVDAHTDYSKRSFFVFKSEEDHGAQTRLVRHYFLRQYNVMIYDKIYLKHF